MYVKTWRTELRKHVFPILFKPGPTLRTCFQCNSTFSIGNKTTFGEGKSSLESLLPGDRIVPCSCFPFVSLYPKDCEFKGTYFFLKFSYCSSGFDAGLNSIFCRRTFLDEDTSLESRSEANLLAMSESLEKFVTGEGITCTATELISIKRINTWVVCLHTNLRWNTFFLTPALKEYHIKSSFRSKLQHFVYLFHSRYLFQFKNQPLFKFPFV